MQNRICSAIQERNLIKVQHKGLERIVEPYLIFISKAGKAVLHAWQVEGQWEKTPPPDWCNINLTDISSVETLDRKFLQPHEGYNPNSSTFHQVICCVK